MPNILLIDIDSRIPNLALHKIQTYFLQCGAMVKWGQRRDLILEHWADQIYVSCVFAENKAKAAEWEGLATIGGSGYDLSIKLPDEIEGVKPRINRGFTTRGCIRKCGFCIVTKKEGGIRAVGDLLDLWDEVGKDIVLMDNNILALPEHFRLVCSQARQHNLRIDFNQGLDHRLLTNDIVDELASIRHVEYKFSFDQLSYENGVRQAIELLADGGIKSSMWFVLVGYNTCFDEDLYRLNLLRALGATAFVQRYKKNRCNLLLSRWANRHAWFRAVTFDEFLSSEYNAKYYKKYQSEIDSYLNPKGGAE